MARDPDKYIFNGVRYLSVTEILHFSGWDDFSTVDPAVLKRASDRGTYCHEASERIDAGLLTTLSDIPEPFNNYLRSYCRFCHEHSYKILFSETVVKCHKRRFAGQCDRICILDGKLTVLDLKTADEYMGKPSWGLQTAAYAMAFMEEWYDTLSKEYDERWLSDIQRYTLCLSYSGVPRLQSWPNPRDYELFIHASETANAQLAAGVIKIPEQTVEEPGEDTVAAQLTRALPELPATGGGMSR